MRCRLTWWSNFRHDWVQCTHPESYHPTGRHENGPTWVAVGYEHGVRQKYLEEYEY